MAPDFQRIAELLDRVATRSRQIHETTLSEHPVHTAIADCKSIHSSRSGTIHDGHLPDPASAHKAIDRARLCSERDPAFRELSAILQTFPGVYPLHSEILIIAGFTPAGNSAMEIRFEKFPAHPRPVTAGFLAKRLRQLYARLAAFPPPPAAARRHWMLRNRHLPTAEDRLLAPSDAHALWKWLCLRHPAAADAALDGQVPALVDTTAIFEAGDAKASFETVAARSDAKTV